MSRFHAALRVVAQYHWSRLYSIKFRQAILAAHVHEPIGYFDRIEISGGVTTLDGWVSSTDLIIETDQESVSLSPNIIREDVQCPVESPGFSVRLKGTRSLRYRVGSETISREIRMSTLPKQMIKSVWSLLTLAPFAWRSRADFVKYFVLGDPLAGDRLESKLYSAQRLTGAPRAAPNLFQPDDQPLAEAAPVDIVVPVYNAHEATQRCLQSLEMHTPTRHRIHLIDDASCDPRIRPMLRSWARRRQNVRLVENSENQGFVGSVNSVLDLTKGHVVLLNSDAFVTNDWVDRLLAPIEADTGISSVTPMSNAAEILSIPVVGRKTALDNGDAERIDLALSRLNAEASSRTIPTGVGFCLALSRHWLDIEPRFDTIFGKGYGEEVDWCCKVAARGGRNIGLGNLFVEHLGASSFGSASVDLKRYHNKIISERFPSFDHQVQEFRSTDPMIGPRMVATLALVSEGAPLPVFLAHDVGGGAELWLQKELKRLIAIGKSALVVRSHQAEGPVTLEVYVGEHRIEGIVPREDLAAFLLVPDQIELIYSCLAMTSEPLEIIQACRDMLRPMDRLKVLFHDYFPICPSHNLIGANGKFCDLPGRKSCAECYDRLAANSPAWPESIDDWRNEWRPLMERADQIVAFSSSSRELLLEVWPVLSSRICVEPHQMDWLPTQATPTRNSRPVIGVLGSVGYQKGANELRKLAMAANGKFDIVVIGDFDESYANPGIRVHGHYKRDEISALTRRYGVNIWFIPSIWPETFCFAARECIATGLPVVGFDLGAQSEALRDSNTGFVVPSDCNPEELRDFLVQLVCDVNSEKPKWSGPTRAPTQVSHQGSTLLQ